MDETTKRILQLMDERNLNDHQLETNAGLSNGSIGKWKRGKYKPSVNAIAKVAAYFDVPISFLLGNAGSGNSAQPPPTAQLSDMEELLLKKFRGLKAEDKLDILNYVIAHK